MNQRPLGYEPNELPDCSTPRCRLKPYGSTRAVSSRGAGSRTNDAAPPGAREDGAPPTGFPARRTLRAGPPPTADTPVVEPTLSGLRCAFEAPVPASPVELRCILRAAEDVLSETWSFSGVVSYGHSDVETTS